MKKLDLSKINFELAKIPLIEEYINELIKELAKKGVIELEEDKDELYKNKLD